jgi:glycosyltransferase involved in cell wall biosynthesis
VTTGEHGGISVVMPAYREEANLAGAVQDVVTTLAAAGEPCHVIIVNDGSDDGTGDIADLLAIRYPGQVLVAHHEVNRGYGAAMRTGIAAALERTDSAWVFLTDSDGQFRAAQIPWFLTVASQERAGAVIGYRPHRADPAMRKVNAWLWTQASRLLLGVRARDVDCAYKLIDRRYLDGLELHGNAALISPELLMKIRARGALVVQRPVHHFPRKHGKPSGARLSVIARSVAGLFGLWRERLSGLAVPKVGQEEARALAAGPGDHRHDA